jgi:hypothetical protein
MLDRVGSLEFMTALFPAVLDGNGAAQSTLTAVWLRLRAAVEQNVSPPSASVMVSSHNSVGRTTIKPMLSSMFRLLHC